MVGGVRLRVRRCRHKGRSGAGGRRSRCSPVSSAVWALRSLSLYKCLGCPLAQTRPQPRGGIFRSTSCRLSRLQAVVRRAACVKVAAVCRSRSWAMATPPCQRRCTLPLAARVPVRPASAETEPTCARVLANGSWQPATRASGPSSDHESIPNRNSPGHLRKILLESGGDNGCATAWPTPPPHLTTKRRNPG